MRSAAPSGEWMVPRAIYECAEAIASDRGLSDELDMMDGLSQPFGEWTDAGPRPTDLPLESKSGMITCAGAAKSGDW